MPWERASYHSSGSITSVYLVDFWFCMDNLRVITQGKAVLVVNDFCLNPLAEHVRVFFHSCWFGPSVTPLDSPVCRYFVSVGSCTPVEHKLCMTAMCRWSSIQHSNYSLAPCFRNSSYQYKIKNRSFSGILAIQTYFSFFRVRLKYSSYQNQHNQVLKSVFIKFKSTNRKSEQQDQNKIIDITARIHP